MIAKTEELKIFLGLAILSLISIPFFVLGQSGATTITTDSSTRDSVTVTGAASKGGGTFVIDHVLDPENKLLYHSFFESPDVKNIYDGVVTLNKKGETVVELPDYFEAVNKDFRYLVTAHGEPMPNLYIKKEVKKNKYTIAGGAPNGRISWQVTGIRHDPYIIENPIIPEVLKGPDALVDKGEFIFPEYYD